MTPAQQGDVECGLGISASRQARDAGNAPLRCPWELRVKPGFWLAIGIAVGAAIGAATHELAIGTGLGVAFGLAVGAFAGSRNRQ